MQIQLPIIYATTKLTEYNYSLRLILRSSCQINKKLLHCYSFANMFRPIKRVLSEQTAKTVI